MDPTVVEVLAANEHFYDVFRRGDVPEMGLVWADDERVACIHPGWAPLRGRSQVMQSWLEILAAGAPPIRAVDATAHIVGELAFVVCYEVVDETHLAATNVFVRVDASWRLLHHHAGPVAQRVELPAGDDYVN